MSAADRAIRTSATVAVLGVAGIAAYISYWHAYEVISAHGETGVTARLEPATIDGLVYCSSMVILYAARHQLRVPALARWLLAVGIVATLAANLAHGWSHGPIGATVAAWPAASLVGSYELLLWLIRTASTDATARRPGTGHAEEPSDQLVPGLRLVPDMDGQQADSPQVRSVGPEGPDHFAGPDIDTDRTSRPMWTGPDHPYQHPAQQTGYSPMADAHAGGGDSEYDINAAAVAAYRASLGELCGLITARRVDHERASAADMRLSKTVATAEAISMLPTEDLFVYVYVLIDDLMTAGVIAIPRRPGPVPACSDAELLAIAQVRHLLGRRSEAAFLAEVARDWAHLFPCLPHQSEANRRIRWLRGAFEQLRVHLARQLPADDCQQIDTTALPVKHTSRVRGPDSWTGPGGLHARFGRDAAHAEWFYGFRLAIQTDLGSRIVRAWSIVPAAVNEREVATDLLETGPPPRDLLLDKGFSGAAFTAGQAARGTAVLIPPAKGQRHRMPPILQKIIAEWRNRIETTFKEITDQMELARHGAHTFWGLLTRTAAIIAAHTLMRVCLAAQ